MYGQKLFFVFILLIITIVAQPERKKTCIHNLVLNGTNLLTIHRKKLLVIGIANFSNQSSRIHAHRYNDLRRELQNHDIHDDSIVSFILINENDAAEYLPGNYYDKIRLFTDNSRDRIIKKLRNNKQTINNFVFGRCGYLIFSQEGSHLNLENGKNYQELLRTITTAVKNKRSCQGLCS